MTTSMGIDLVIRHKDKIALFKDRENLVLPGVSEIKYRETVKDAAMRAAMNYIGQEVKLKGMVALYGPEHAGLKPGCKSSILMYSETSKKIDNREGMYLVSPSETSGMGLNSQQEALIRSYLEWEDGKKPRPPMSRMEKWNEMLKKF